MLNTGKLRWTESANGNVNTIALVGQGTAQQLVMGGHFTKVGRYARHKVAMISPQTGGVDASAGAWHPAAAGSDLGVYAELAYGQHVYFGGDFLEWQVHPGVVEQAHLADFASTAAADVTAPIVKAPAVKIAKGATIGTAKVPLSLALTASDPGSGVCRLQVKRRYFTNPYAPVPLLLATSRSGGASVSPAARDYTFAVAATDCSDNTSAFVAAAPVRLTAFQNSSRSITYRRRLERRPRAQRLRRIGAPVGRRRRERDAALHRPRDRLGGDARPRLRQRAGADRRPRGRDRPPAGVQAGAAPGRLHPHVGHERRPHHQDRGARHARPPAGERGRPADAAVIRQAGSDPFWRAPEPGRCVFRSPPKGV